MPSTIRPLGPSARNLEGWATQMGWEVLLDRAGTMFASCRLEKAGRTSAKAVR